MLNFVDKLKCTDATIFYEKEKPYLKWTGEGKTDKGISVIIDIPKISLDMIGVQFFNDYSPHGFYIDKIEHILFEGNPGKENEWYTIRTKEREVSKTQLEKELGYKIKLI